MQSSRAVDYPGNRVEFTYAVPPGAIVYGDWIDLSAPSLVTIDCAISGLQSYPDEYLSVVFYGRVAYDAAEAPEYAPGTNTKDEVYYPVPIGGGGDSYPEDYRRALLVMPRWCYVSLEPQAGNTHTADVTMTLVT
jgi:hypothetical protein